MAKATAELCEVRLNTLCVFDREEEGGGEVKWERVVGRREREGKRQRNDQLAIKTKHLNRCCRKL